MGPSLANYGVVGPLPDPILTLYGSGGPIAVGTVGTTDALDQFAQLVGAFPLSQGTKDSTMAIRLAPGPYSAQATSAAGATGVVLLEVYEVP